MRKLVLFFLVLCFLSAQSQYRLEYYNQKRIKSDTTLKGAVTTAHPIATKIGVDILQKGGNAFDAAIAIQFALAVVYPEAGNIGGGGFMLAKLPNDSFIALDFREKAPLKANVEIYLDKDGKASKEKIRKGYLSCGVPGTIAGINEMYRYAKLDFKELIDPAIELAEKGFCLTKAEAHKLNKYKSWFIKINGLNTNPFSIEYEWQEGDTFVQADLAKTLKRISVNPKHEFYNGLTAQLIVLDMQKNNGLIQGEDLRKYSTVYKKPIQFNYKKDYTIYTFPPPSRSSIVMKQLFYFAEKQKLSNYAFHSLDAIHLIVEMEKIAFSDAEYFLGDPDFINIPMEELHNNDYLNARNKLISLDKVQPSKNINHGDISITHKEKEETTHFNVVDEYGNIIAITTTLNGNYGSYVVVSGTGVLLNNEMDDFTVQAGVANMYGAYGSSFNLVEPEKRMVSSMSPTFVMRKNKPYLVVGSPGGTTIPTSVFQTIVNVIDFNLSAEDAVWQSRFHHQWLPDNIYVEPSFSKNIVEQLRKKGHQVVIRETPLGRVELLLFKDNGEIISIADIRGDDEAGGY